MKKLVLNPLAVRIGTSPMDIPGSELSALASHKSHLATMQMELSRLRTDLRQVASHVSAPALLRAARARGVNLTRSLNQEANRCGRRIAQLQNLAHKLAVQSEMGVRGVPGLQQEIARFGAHVGSVARRQAALRKAIRTWEATARQAVRRTR